MTICNREKVGGCVYLFIHVHFSFFFVFHYGIRHIIIHYSTLMYYVTDRRTLFSLSCHGNHLHPAIQVRIEEKEGGGSLSNQLDAAAAIGRGI